MSITNTITGIRIAVEGRKYPHDTKRYISESKMMLDEHIRSVEERAARWAGMYYGDANRLHRAVITSARTGEAVTFKERFGKLRNRNITVRVIFAPNYRGEFVDDMPGSFGGPAIRHG
jgi:hypothetical protein